MYFFISNDNRDVDITINEDGLTNQNKPRIHTPDRLIATTSFDYACGIDEHGNGSCLASRLIKVWETRSKNPEIKKYTRSINGLNIFFEYPSAIASVKESFSGDTYQISTELIMPYPVYSDFNLSYTNLYISKCNHTCQSIESYLSKKYGTYSNINDGPVLKISTSTKVINNERWVEAKYSDILGGGFIIYAKEINNNIVEITSNVPTESRGSIVSIEMNKVLETLIIE